MRNQILQEQLSGFANKATEWNFKRLKQKSFGANKPWKYLTWQLKKKRGKIINKIIEGKK